MNYDIILNRKSGTDHFGSEDNRQRLCERVEEAGHRVNLHIVDPDVLEDRIRKSVNSDADVILVGGGDGSVVTAAKLMQGSSKILGIVPLGTFNLAARAVEVPIDPMEAIEALLNAEPAEVDLLKVNDYSCLCLTVLGFYPHLARARQKFRGRPWWMKAFRVLYEMLILAVRTPVLDLKLEADDASAAESSDRKSRAISTQTRMAVFCPGSYQDSIGIIPERGDLDTGKLTAYVMEGTGRWQLIKAGFGYLSGKLLQADEMQMVAGRSMTLDVRGRASLLAMIDGEIIELGLPCELKLKPRSLRVLRPRH